MREIPLCDGISEKNGIIQVPNDTCREHLQKNWFFESTFSIPENESCQFWGNGFKFKSNGSKGITTKIQKFKYEGS